MIRPNWSGRHRTLQAWNALLGWGHGRHPVTDHEELPGRFLA
jgi:hypothetical protein